MKSLKSPFHLLLVLLLGILINCNDRETTNPFDANCPKELFTPSDFKAEQQGAAVKLTWNQKNTNISGFIISRNENDGTMSEVAKTDKSATGWSDNAVTGGKKFSYELVAYADKNLSNPQKVSITPVTGAIVTTVLAATNLTPLHCGFGRQYFQ